MGPTISRFLVASSALAVILAGTLAAQASPPATPRSTTSTKAEVAPLGSSATAAARVVVADDARSLPPGFLVAGLSPSRAGVQPGSAVDDPKMEAMFAGRIDDDTAPEPPHKAPLLKLSYRQLPMPNLDHSLVQFHGGQLDIYPLSRRWIRIGIEAQGGVGQGDLDQVTAKLWYATLGVNAGFQYPWRVTPFVEGRAAAGVLGGEAMGFPAVTYTYQGGVEGGIELYLVSRIYVSASVGWVHPVYRGIDYAAFKANPSAEMKTEDISGDELTFKVGFGL